MHEQYTATAVVATETPSRYIKQLGSHLGHRCEILELGEVTRIVLASGSCDLQATDDAILLSATAPSRENLEQVTDVVGSHLERFAHRSSLTVAWSVARRVE